jgi:hypothetical protein
MDVEKLIEHLERRGLSNGSSLGPHSGLYDEAADAFTALLAENEKLRAELSQIRESLDFDRTKDAEILRLGMELAHLKKHMERLTHRLGNGELTCNMAKDDCRKMGGDCQIDSKILDRLAAYEDTGLEPEKIELLAKQRTLPAADVAEVVRCKDCQYYQDAKINKKGFLICPASGMEISETDYCSYGTRMGQENKHKVRCAKCRKIKEIVCTVDGKPWCEDCFDKAMGCGDQV